MYFSDLLKSIGAQTYKPSSVLIGIDGSESDRQWLRQNPVNYTVISYSDNRGPYITFNTLVTHVTTSHVLFFGADDIMQPDLLEKVMLTGDCDIVRFGFTQFGLNAKPGIAYPAYGAFLVKTEIFRNLNGFYDWKCAADAEFMYRAKSKGASELILKEPLFRYRRHNNCLTISKETSMTSAFRKRYTSIIDNCKRKRVWDNPKSYLTRTDVLTDV